MPDANLIRDDHALLHDFVQRQSSDAFSALVQRHVDAVFSSALRRANGDRALAEDITQQVFTDFARKAAGFTPGTVVGGWLHRHTGFTASHFMDRERRRRAREQEAAAMNALADHADDGWQRTAPLLDAAMDALPSADRDALVLRFFEKRDFRAVGQALGVSDDTAQKRVSRALEKLRALLTRRGVTSSGTALAAMLLAGGVSEAPAAAFAAALPVRALTGAVSRSTLAAAAAGLSHTARWKLAAAAAGLILAGAVPAFLYKVYREPSPAVAVKISPASPAEEVTVKSPAPPREAAPAVSPSLEDLITRAAAALRGGAQDVSATAQALAQLTQIPADRTQEALALTAAVPDESARALLYKMLLSRWAETQPWEALQFAQKLPEQHRLAVSEGVLSAWAARDPEAVLGWGSKSTGMGPLPARETLIATIFKSLASRDLKKAFLYLPAARSLNERAQALRGILDTVQTPADRERILAAAAGISDQETRTQTRRAVVETWARREPAAAAAWVEKAEPAWERPRLMDSLGLTWLQSDPAAAAAWWIAREPGPDTLVKIINVWSQEDPNAAGEWLRTQPPGPQSDTARMTFARQVMDLDPESALSWAATVSEESMRHSTSDLILKNWRAREPEAAARWESEHSTQPTKP